MRVLLSLFAASTVLAPGPAMAADDAIGVSLDGVSFSDSITTPLFDPDVRWVPGDSRSAVFYVRNQGPTQASMSIEAIRTAPDADLADDLSIQARVAEGPWVDLTDVVRRELTVQPIPRGATRAVDVRVSFDRASTNQTQREVVPLLFRVTMTQAGSGNAVDPGTGDSDDGILPATGAAFVWWLLIVAVFATTFGAMLVRRTDEARHG